MTSIRERVLQVQHNIAAASERSGRSPDDVTLVAVTKTHPVETVLEAIDAGLQQFGENRVEESQDKIPGVLARTGVPITWHMIGHVQSRKARDVAPLFNVVHSVDSLKLARKLAAALPEGKPLRVLLEMNVSGEESKEGIDAANWMREGGERERLAQIAREILEQPGLDVRGLMTVAPLVADAEEVRPVFVSLRGLRDYLAETLQHPLPDLSMGMTDDYMVAIEEGATLVRVGRALFGERLR
jgi:pyridoxal phosphate enzyme (YggS family)